MLVALFAGLVAAADWLVAMAGCLPGLVAVRPVALWLVARLVAEAGCRSWLPGLVVGVGCRGWLPLAAGGAFFEDRNLPYLTGTMSMVANVNINIAFCT